ncbi:MAG TPA: RNA methyltransferase [Bryobacteraceae bacterium]|nr:RNA methyltransferase [Bryobacteraceae bacterium]
MSIPAEFERLKVVLVEPRNPLNIGAAARAMSNFGFLRLRVVQPYEAGYREARSAVGASSVLTNAEEFASVAEAAADCTLVVGTTAVGERELHHRVKALPEAGKIIRRKMASQNVALLFGSERVGLSNDDLSHCHWVLRIPTRQEHRSMNLGQAVAVCMYELARDAKRPLPQGRTTKKAVPAAQLQPATAGDIERISKTLIEALHACGYLTPRSGKTPEEKIRRLLRRHNLTANDADLWLSMIGQMLYRLKNQPPRR